MQNIGIQDPFFLHVQLVFASCHRLILSNNMPKGCLMVMANPLDLGHGKNDLDLLVRAIHLEPQKLSYLNSMMVLVVVFKCLCVWCACVFVSVCLCV